MNIESYFLPCLLPLLQKTPFLSWFFQLDFGKTLTFSWDFYHGGLQSSSSGEYFSYSPISYQLMFLLLVAQLKQSMQNCTKTLTTLTK